MYIIWIFKKGRFCAFAYRIFFTAIVFLTFIPTLAFARASDITTINFRQSGKDIVINAFLQFDEKTIDDIYAGLPKEIVYTIELIKNRRFFPNEIIKSVVILKSIKSNPIKREYIGVMIHSGEKSSIRFNDITSMITWGGTLQEIRLADIDIDESGEYFIRVSAEARMLALPAVIDFLLFFVPTKEFSVSKETYLFRLNTHQSTK